MSLPACPLPQLDFDVVTLAHGSGGLLTNRLLDEVIFKVLNNKFLADADDGAVIDVSGQTAITTDSFVVSPLFFPGGNIGDLAVNGTVNDVAMCGATPRYISLGLILEEGLLIEKLWDVLVSIRDAAHDAGVQVVTGDTKVVDRGKGDGIFINTTGFGQVHPKANVGMHRVQNGDHVIVSGPIASHGMAIMALRKGIEFDAPIKSDTAPVAKQVTGLLDTIGESIRFFRDPTRGGVATVLNELARHSQFGIELDESSLPVLDPVNDLCDILGIDPLFVANEGIFITIVDPGTSKQCVSILRDLGAEQPAVIGKVSSQYGKSVVVKSLLGGKRVVPMPLGEQLPRIC